MEHEVALGSFGKGVWEGKVKFIGWGWNVPCSDSRWLLVPQNPIDLV